MEPRRRLLILVLFLTAVAACQAAERKVVPDGLTRAWTYNAAAPSLMPGATLDSLLAPEQDLPTSRRIGLWARRFAADSTNVYCFGLKPGGYVSEGRLVDDVHVDCISLLYRVTELAQARTARDAVASAFAMPTMRQRDDDPVLHPGPVGDQADPRSPRSGE